MPLGQNRLGLSKGVLHMIDLEKILQRLKNEQQQRTKKKSAKYAKGFADCVQLISALLALAPTQGELVLTEVAILAHVIYGERPNLCGDHKMEAAEMIGYTFLNRLDEKWWGTTYLEVSEGFHGFNPKETVPTEYFDLAQRLIVASERTTSSLFVLSWNDMKQYGKKYLAKHAIWGYDARIEEKKYGLYGFKVDPMKIKRSTHK